MQTSQNTSAEPRDRVPLISVIVPVYNATPFLDRCVASIVGQQGLGSEFEIEILLLDDGSTDGCGELCERYQETNPRIRCYRFPHAGVYPVRNRGLDLALGDYLAFCDADDYLEPDAYSLLLRPHLDGVADFTMGKMTLIQEQVAQGFLGGVDVFLPPKKQLLYLDDIDGKPKIHFHNGLTTFLIRRDIIQTYKIRFNEDTLAAGDGDFMIELSRLPLRYLYLDKPVYNYYRQMGNSITSTYSPTKLRRTSEVIRHIRLLRQRLLRDYDVGRVDAAIGGFYVSFMIRYLVICAADSLVGRDAYNDFKNGFFDPELRLLLRFYRAAGTGKGKGRSWLLPWLMRLGMVRTAFLICRHKAAKRYGREIKEITKKGLTA